MSKRKKKAECFFCNKKADRGDLVSICYSGKKDDGTPFRTVVKACLAHHGVPELAKEYEDHVNRQQEETPDEETTPSS